MKKPLAILVLISACAADEMRLPCGAHETNDWGDPPVDYRYEWDADGRLVLEEQLDLDGNRLWLRTAAYDQGFLVHEALETDRLLWEYDVTMFRGRPSSAVFDDNDTTDGKDHSFTQQWSWNGDDLMSWTRQVPTPDIYDLRAELRWIDGGYEIEQCATDSPTMGCWTEWYLGPADFLGDEEHWTRFENDNGSGTDRSFDDNGQILTIQHWNVSDGPTDRIEYKREPNGTPLRRDRRYQTGYSRALVYAFECTP